MGNYLLSVAALSAAGSLFLQGDAGEPMTWAYLALAGLACIIALRAFAHGVFGPRPVVQRSRRDALRERRLGSI